MVKPDKVIAGLEFCGEANKSVDACLMMCPYYGERDGDKVCMDFLMEDALELLKEYRGCLIGCGIRQYGMEGLNGKTE